MTPGIIKTKGYADFDFFSKTLAGAPQYTLRIKDWKTDPITEADAFAFKPPEGATKVNLESDVMMEFDEIPPGAAAGAKK